MTMKAISSYFVDLNKVGNGGAIEVSRKRTFVSFCFFINLSVSTHGGSIYAINSPINILKSSFYQTYSSKNENDKGNGNAFCIIRSSLTISDNINVRKCGVSPTLCSDSSIRLSSCFAKLENYNSTNNYGVGGAGGMSILGALDGSFQKFINIVYPLDLFAIESNKLCNFSHSNIVNTEKCSYVIYMSKDYFLKFESCIFINNKSKFSNLKYYAINCIADAELESITYVANYETIDISIKLMNKCSNVIRCKNNYSCFMCLSIIALLISS